MWYFSGLIVGIVLQITLGTITCIDEAIEWLSYTYLFVRMRINPQEYGMNYADVEVCQFILWINVFSY